MTDTATDTAFESIFFIAADPQTVWDAITGDAGNRAVMWGSVLRGDLVPGGRYEYVGPGEDGDQTVHVYGEVLQAEAPRILQLVEHPGPTYRDNHAELTSRLTWVLEPAGEGVTKAVFTNDDWSPGNPAREHTHETWPLVLSSWKSYLETGRPLPMG